MNEVRFVEDLLRAEYVALQPSMQRILAQVETEVRYALLPLTLPLDRYERILVRGRLKECESEWILSGGGRKAEDLSPKIQNVIR
jgi:hypothetical protein